MHDNCRMFRIFREKVKDNIISRSRNMVGKGTTVQKREYERYKVLSDVSVMLRNGSIEVGQLLDISVDGLALSCISGVKRIEGWFQIYLYSIDQFFLINMPFRVISDSLVEDMTLFRTIMKKRCGGQVGELTNQQRSHLDHFIAHHTIG